jgi:integrase
LRYTDANGIRHTEHYRTMDEAERQRTLRLAEIADGLPVSSKPNRVLFEELAADVITDYKINKRKSLDDIDARLRLHILPVLGKRKASQITTADLKIYIRMRMGETPTPANGTINRELEAIRHTFRLAMIGRKLFHMPHVPMLVERNVRTGFLTRQEVDRLCSSLEEPYRSFTMFGFFTGWRYEEIQELEWRHIDFVASEIRLDPGTTKNGDGRVFPFTAELRQLLKSVRASEAKPKNVKFGRPEETDKVAAIVPYVFTAYGQKVGAFRKSWARACYKAGLPCTIVPETFIAKRGPDKGKECVRVKKIIPARTFHDLRRSAAREMRNQGVSERVIMELMGHRTRSMFDRYSIVSREDLAAAAAAIDGAQKGRQKGHSTGG